MKQNLPYWIGGTIIALFGVGLVRLLAPALAGSANSLTAAAGYLLVIVGIAIVARAAGRRGSEALATIEREAKD